MKADRIRITIEDRGALVYRDVFDLPGDVTKATLTLPEFKGSARDAKITIEVEMAGVATDDAALGTLEVQAHDRHDSTRP